MNEEFVIEFIRQRMMQMGVEDFHFESLFMEAPKDGATYKLYNELWYLVGWPLDVKIISDTAYYSYTPGNLVIMNPPEFTGSVFISATVNDIMVQFVRVIIQK